MAAPQLPHSVVLTRGCPTAWSRPTAPPQPHSSSISPHLIPGSVRYPQPHTSSPIPRVQPLGKHRPHRAGFCPSTVGCHREVPEGFGCRPGCRCQPCRVHRQAAARGPADPAERGAQRAGRGAAQPVPLPQHHGTRRAGQEDRHHPGHRQWGWGVGQGAGGCGAGVWGRLPSTPWRSILAAAPNVYVCPSQRGASAPCPTDPAPRARVPGLSALYLVPHV